MTSSKPLPRVNQDSAPYWQAASEGRLILRHCNTCGKRHFYPRIICPFCHSTELDWVEATGRGTIYSATACYRAPDQAFRADLPYLIALIDLEEGVRMMANVTHCPPEDARIGAPVQAWFEPAADEIGIPKFKLSKS
jgi:uncharacterized OB-fold protein